MSKAEATRPDPKDRVLAQAPAGHTHAGQVLPEPAEIVLRREQAERFGFEVRGPAPADE